MTSTDDVTLNLPKDDEFPPDFIWGCATAAYQIEGGFDADGKGPSIWDDFTHAGKCRNNETADVACDHYNRMESDVKLLQDLGFKHYRLSLSWPRMFPDGTVANENAKGVDFYNRLIDTLIAHGVTPCVTLYHWDLPSTLQNKYGGLKGREFIADFTAYAERCFQLFGDRVCI